MVSSWAKVEGCSTEVNGLIEVLHYSELLVAGEEMRVSLRERAECFSADDNDLIEVLHCSELLVPIGETLCKVV